MVVVKVGPKDAPYKNRNATPGHWSIRAEAAGYAIYEGTFEAPPDDVTVHRIQLQKLGSLKVEGKPQGAEVTVTGPSGFSGTGGLPVTVRNLTPGTYQVKVTRKGYEEVVKAATIAQGGAAVVGVELVRVSSDPRAGTRRVVKVKSIHGLADAIAPNTHIMLEPGEYDISELGKIERTYVKTNGGSDGFGLSISGVSNLVIEANGNTASIVASSPWETVVQFNNCKQVALRNLKLGHKTQGYCNGSVLDFFDTTSEVQDCDLYGSGTIGIEAHRSTVTVERGRIYDCTYGAVSAGESTVDIRGTMINSNQIDCALVSAWSDNGPSTIRLSRLVVSDNKGSCADTVLFKANEGSRIELDHVSRSRGEGDAGVSDPGSPAERDRPGDRRRRL